MRFHKLAIGCNPAPGTKPQVKWGKLLLYNKSCMTGLKKIIDDIKNQEDNTEFKRIVCKYGDNYLKQAEEAYEVLKSSKYMNIVEKYMKLNSICIGDFSKKKILRYGEKLIVKKLNNCCYDIPCTDVGRILIKNINNPLWCKEFLDAYMKSSKMSKDELIIVYSMVLVPRETYKIIKRYYENKAGLDKRLLLKKLIEIVEQQEQKKDVLDYIKQVSI
jgi:CotS family spore coat protein